MNITDVMIHTVRMPLVSPFATSFGVQTERLALILETQTVGADGSEMTGWGECVAMADPLYSPEYLEGARDVLTRYLIPALVHYDGVVPLTAEIVGHVLRPFIGHPMAKAALEMSVLDAQLRRSGQSLSSYFGGTVDRIPSGVSIGIQPSIEALLEAVQGYLDEGYLRIKLKIKPGLDIAPVRAVRERFGDELLLQVDANAAYTLVDAPLLRQLDEFGLLLIEQPLAEDDIRQHAELAKQMATPICLDESIVSAASAADAISLGAAAVINIKPGRVGGYLEARRIHDLAQAHGVAVWCGGMLETGLGRAANAALASMPGFTLPGDISSSHRFYTEDLTEPIVIKDGYVAVPTCPGLGATPIPERLEEFTISTQSIRA